MVGEIDSKMTRTDRSMKCLKWAVYIAGNDDGSKGELMARARERVGIWRL